MILYYHPLSSCSWKVLIALYENGTAFEPRALDDAAAAQSWLALWPLGKFPVLRDEARDRTIAETSIIVEYLGQHHPGPFRPIPQEADAALEVRLMDRLFDIYVMTPMQAIVADKIRPEGVAHDTHGVGEARRMLGKAYALLEDRMAGRRWAAGGRLHPRRLRGGACALLCGQDRAHAGRLSPTARLSGTAGGAGELCAGAARKGTMVAYVPLCRLGIARRPEPIAGQEVAESRESSASAPSVLACPGLERPLIAPGGRQSAPDRSRPPLRRRRRNRHRRPTPSGRPPVPCRYWTRARFPTSRSPAWTRRAGWALD